MKFGDIVVNEWAGDSNPEKALMFIRKTSAFCHCLSLEGNEVMFRNDDNLRLTVVGSLDLRAWKTFNLLNSDADGAQSEDEPMIAGSVYCHFCKRSRHLCICKDLTKSDANEGKA